MLKHARCAVGFCDNDKRYPDLAYVRSHVNNLTFHKWPVDPKLAEIWRKQVAKTRGDVFNPSPGASGTFVCSNHFPLGRRTPENPETDYQKILERRNSPTEEVLVLKNFLCLSRHQKPR